jgi:hypothetical protein
VSFGDGQVTHQPDHLRRVARQLVARHNQGAPASNAVVHSSAKSDRRAGSATPESVNRAQKRR